jgi:hypothetical protein
MLSKTKKKLIANLRNNTYCRLKPDSFGGVGVFAVKDIPMGKNPFLYPSGACIHKSTDIPDSYIKQLDPEVQKMVTDFYGMNENGTWTIPKAGLNGNDISFYLNTSKNNNLKIVSTEKCDMVIFKTTRYITAGEELFIDYDHY